MTAGLAITQLLPPFHVAGGRKLIGIPLMVLGTSVAALSYRTWRRNEQAMRLGRPLPRSWLPQIAAAVVSVVALVGLVIALVGGPGH